MQTQKQDWSVGVESKGSILAQSFILKIFERSAEQLKDLRYNLAKCLHAQFLLAVDKGFKGLVICDPFCAGKTGDALATIDGASKYVRGALSLTTKEALNDNAQSMIANLEKFLNSTAVDMKVDLVIGLAKEDRLYRTFIYEKGKEAPTPELIFDIPENLKQGLEAKKELASIVTLITAAEWLARELANPDIITEVEKCIEESRFTNHPLLQKAKQINQAHAEAWEVLSLVVNDLPAIVLGESFTFGKLADVLFRYQVNTPLQTAYGWYDPDYKVAVGVPKSFVSESLIAEPATVIEGARGLIKTFGSDLSLAIGTSGWANYWKEGEADFFSIAICSKVNGADYVQAKRFTVNLTRHEPLDVGRRELTRELGVAVSISMLASYLEAAKSERAKTISVIREKLDLEIAKYGNYT